MRSCRAARPKWRCSARVRKYRRCLSSTRLHQLLDIVADSLHLSNQSIQAIGFDQSKYCRPVPLHVSLRWREHEMVRCIVSGTRVVFHRDQLARSIACLFHPTRRTLASSLPRYGLVRPRKYFLADFQIAGAERQRPKVYACGCYRKVLSIEPIF